MFRGISRLSLRNYSAKTSAPKFVYQNVFETATEDPVEYTRIDELSDQISVETMNNQEYLRVPGSVLTGLSERSFVEISHLLRPSHLQQLANILKDPESSENDRFVALEFLKNANIASGMILPGCQDTGTAICVGKRGHQILTDGDDESHISAGVYNTYTNTNLRYSQVAPKSMFEEVNTKTNLPAQIDLYSVKGQEYKLLFMAKGGGSANKTFLFQQTKALLNESSFYKFIEEKVQTLGTSACPPYHLAVVVGGLSAEYTLKTVKLASARFLDNIHTSGNEHGRAFRDLEAEDKIHKLTQRLGIGAQFGGKYFCHDVRVVRLPRHGASCPVGLGVSCSADRQQVVKVTKKGVFMEKLEREPSKYLPEVSSEQLASTIVKVNLNEGIDKVRATLSKYPIKTQISLSGTLIVARDIAHAKLKEVLEKTGDLPDYIKQYPVYYAGPAKTPEGYASGSFGPTTAGRMDSYVEEFQSKGGSMIMLAKGNRSKAVTNACKKYGGFYLGSIGGPAAILAQNCIKKMEVHQWPELGMEAVWKIEVEDFPAFIVVDDKGNDFFSEWKM